MTGLRLQTVPAAAPGDIIAGLTGDKNPEVARERALAAVATLVGAITLSRVVDDPKLSKAILRSAEASVIS